MDDRAKNSTRFRPAPLSYVRPDVEIYLPDAGHFALENICGGNRYCDKRVPEPETMAEGLAALFANVPARQSIIQNS
jgi:hypothetical protein